MFDAEDLFNVAVSEASAKIIVDELYNDLDPIAHKDEQGKILVRYPSEFDEERSGTAVSVLYILATGSWSQEQRKILCIDRCQVNDIIRALDSDDRFRKESMMFIKLHRTK